MAAGSSGHSENFLGQIIKARKSLYCGFSSGWGASIVIAFSLQGFHLVNAGFRDEKCQLFLLYRGHFLCNVMSNPSQNYEGNILPRTVSHVNIFNEIKGSNLFGLICILAKQIRLVMDAKLTGITDHHKKSIISSPVHLRLTSHWSFYKIKVGVKNKL